MNMDQIPPQMTINPSEISVNYPTYGINPTSDPNYPEDIFIPPLTANPTEDLLQIDPDNTENHRQTWQTHFRREQLRFRDRLRHTTYHWVAHLLTEHHTWIYHPTFGLTPILECDNFANNVTIPRNSLEEVIVIPPGTACENCKTTCRLIQRIELERAESQALEEYILLVLDNRISPFILDPTVDTTQHGITQPQQPSTDTSTESHGTSFPSTATTGHTRAGDAGRNSNTIDPKSTTISGTATSTATEPQLCSNSLAGTGTNGRDTTDSLHTSTPRGICDPLDPAEASWEIRGRTIYST
jgi:hypothetical protein